MQQIQQYSIGKVVIFVCFVIIDVYNAQDLLIYSAVHVEINFINGLLILIVYLIVQLLLLPMQ
jgi:hypothetical protein